METLLSIGLFVSLLTPHSTPARASVVPVIERNSLVMTLASSSPEMSSTTLIALLAKKYGQDPELAKRIIWCESKNDPDVISKTDDAGFFQLNQIHIPEMKAMGLDRTKWQDNLEFGFYLMKRDGLSPWKSSESCWRE